MSEKWLLLISSDSSHVFIWISASPRFLRKSHQWTKEELVRHRFPILGLKGKEEKEQNDGQISLWDYAIEGGRVRQRKSTKCPWFNHPFELLLPSLVAHFHSLSYTFSYYKYGNEQCTKRGEKQKERERSKENDYCGLDEAQMAHFTLHSFNYIIQAFISLSFHYQMMCCRFIFLAE